MNEVKQFFKLIALILIRIIFLITALVIVTTIVFIAAILFVFWLIRSVWAKLLNKPQQPWQFNNFAWRTFYRFRSNWDKTTDKPKRNNKTSQVPRSNGDDDIVDVTFKS